MLQKKILIFIKSDGFVPTLKYMFQGLKYRIYHCAGTVFLDMDMVHTEIEVQEDQALHFQLFTEYDDELKKVCFPRLFLLPVERWLQQGSKLLMGYYKGQAVSFAWVHRNHYLLHGTGTVILKPGEEIWIGPVFVHKTARSLGINTRQIRHLLAVEKQNGIKRCLTCVSQNNAASLKSFTKNGFQVLGTRRKVSGIFRFLKPEYQDNTAVERVEICYEDVSADA